MLDPRLRRTGISIMILLRCDDEPIARGPFRRFRLLRRRLRGRCCRLWASWPGRCWEGGDE